MTYDTRDRPADPPENNSQSDGSSAEQSEVSPEDLVAGFPVGKLQSLNAKINSPRWVVPVLPDQELECLLNYAIKLSQAGIDFECEPCVRFYRDGLTVSFTKILTDEAVNSWKLNIHNNILMLCGKLLHLCALHMKVDNTCLLDLLAIVLDAENKFHTHNASRQSELFSVQGATAEGLWGTLLDNQVFAKSPSEPRPPRGWLVDLINRFGQLGGFDNFLERFNAGVALIKKQSIASTEEAGDTPQSSSGCASSLSLSDEASKMKTSTISSSGTNSTSTSILLEESNKLSLPVIFMLLRPFGQCHELLTSKTIEKYFQPMWEPLIEILENLSDDELKRDAKLEGKNDVVNGIIKCARLLISHSPNAENLIKDLEMCRLKIILRVLQISSFNGKMNALNEINKVLSYVCYYPHRPQSEDEGDTLTAEKMAKWIKDTDVLGIVLKDSLHQPQYVEKLEKILRFLIKEKALTLDDLAAVWRAQAGKHEAIVKNVHDLLAKLAWDFNAEQLDYLFECFQTSMKTANKKQRERLLELNRRLAEDDKNGVMADKVLRLFWSLAHSPDIPPEVLDQALASHVKILDYSCSQDKDAQKPVWLNMCVEELKVGDDEWALPALRLIREICCLYEPTPSHVPRAHSMSNRQHVIDRLQNEHTLVILVTNSLTKYMERIRELVRTNKTAKPMEIMLDKRYPHPQQIQERLDFLKFLLKDGQLWLCADQAKQIWQCLAVNAAFPSDREECFRWFGKLMGDEPDLDPGINKEFFENNILQLDPQLLTESGIKCFERFFKAVNSKEDKLKAKHRGYVLDDEDLIGKDYLWQVITLSGEEIAYKAIELLKEVSTALGPRLQETISDFHENFISDCCDKIKITYERILMLSKALQDSVKDRSELESRRMMEADKICRVLRVMQEYIKECDRVFTGERQFLSLSRASRGKHICLYIRFQTNGRQLEDIEVTTHTNETVISFKRNLLKRLKGTSINNIKIDLFNNNGELIEISDDRHPLSLYNIRDKTIINVKLSPMGTALASSPDSSSDSSTGSPPRPCPDMQRPESEATLPGVIISTKTQYLEFFLKLHQMGSDLQHNALRECARTLLHLLPLDIHTVNQIHQMCLSKLQGEKSDVQDALLPETMFLSADAAHVLYNLEVLQALLMPALDPHGESTMRLQLAWLHSGVAHFILDLLTKNNFMPMADMHCKRAAYQCVLKLVKLFLFILGYVLSRVGDEPLSTHAEKNRMQVDILKQTLATIVCNSDHTMRAIASKLAQSISDEMLSESPEGENCRLLFQSALQWSLPDVATLKSLVHLAWASSTGSFQLMTKPSELGQENGMPEALDFAVCKEALEVLCFSLVLNHNGYEALSSDPNWSIFVISLVLINGSRHIRQTASEQIFYTCTYCAADRRPFTFMVKLMVETLKNSVTQYSSSCSDFFALFCRILKFGCNYNGALNVCDNLLMQEIEWIRSIRDNVKQTGETGVHEDLLEGRLNLTKELMAYVSYEVKPQLSDLIVELVDDFIFPASKQYLHFRRNGQLSDLNAPPQVCRNPHTMSAACDLLVALCTNSVPNMKLLVNTLLDMFCFEIEPLQEWEYLPPVGPRPKGGFSGLKNAGATCYMNSVLQQLFMVPSIRLGILGAAGACTDPNEDFSGELDNRVVNELQNDDGNGRRNYHIGILKHVQAIFAHLGHSVHQFYIPRGLWGHFKLQGEPVNLREQQDAVEFFMSLFESLDEGLKALGHQQLMGATLGGCFSDQKICQECPHRYSKEEPFSVFSIDIRNHSSLTDSLEQYVKGELLEGADAYHCDKCDKKVVTVKRMCVRKLPPVLAIQLKRFEYDYERVCAIKFNDYFEFPRWLDMEPYTVSGLAKLEGEIADIDECEDETQPTKYQLTGIVVHSGQASGGHYYSYILHKNESGNEQWYKFDDGEVTECKMHEDEELKAQCFGGDYMGEVYDNNLKRMQFRRQKRWWNAYMLFYTRVDHKQTVYKPCIEQLSLAESKNCILPMPAPIEKSVRFQNIRFLHARSLFSAEFFAFIRNLVSCSGQAPRVEKMTPAAEEISLLSIQLASQFLFQFGFRTKKTLRGAAIEWFEAISPHIRNSAVVRRWFAQNALLSPQNRLAEYILVASSLDIRAVFVKIIVFFCHFASQDEPLPNCDGSNLCEQVLLAVLSLLICEAAEYGKHLPHYFNLFVTYAMLGVHERHQLLKLNVPALFMKVALDEGPGPPIKYQYPELNKLHQCVSILVRASDISSRCQSSSAAIPVKPNIYVDPKVPHDQLLPLSPDAEELLLNRTSYIKKLIEDVNVGEEGLKLLQYCSWENPQFSQALLTELLWHCGFAYWHDMRHHTDLLLNILLIEDSWQHHRIHNALMGVSEDREGLLDTIQRNRLNYQKRAYQCIKCLVQLFRKSPLALNMLQANNQISRPWASAVEWLHDELDRQRGVASQYNYSSWSPPAQSNENTNSFILERSQSAKNVLQMAFELCPEEEPEEPNDSEVEPIDDIQQPTTKVTREITKDDEALEDIQAQLTLTAEEEAVNKVVEKIETLRMVPRQELEIDETTSNSSPIILAGDLPDPEVEIVPGKIVNIQPTAPIQSGITEQKS